MNLRIWFLRLVYVVSCYLSSFTHTRVNHRDISFTRACHCTNEYISRVSHTCEHIQHHTRYHTCGIARVIQCTTHMHIHAMCATTITSVYTLTSASSTTGCMCTTYKYLHKYVHIDSDSPSIANVSPLVFTFVDSTRHTACIRKKGSPQTSP